MYSQAHIERLCLSCEEYKLQGRESVFAHKIEELCEIYNGAGPDSWLPLSRDVLTSIMTLFEPVILIHDVQFDASDGTDKGFQHTVSCWENNTRAVFDANYPLWTLKMLKREYRIRRTYWWGVMKASNLAISSSEAREAWLAAAERRTANA